MDWGEVHRGEGSKRREHHLLDLSTSFPSLAGQPTLSPLSPLAHCLFAFALAPAFKTLTSEHVNLVADLTAFRFCVPVKEAGG